MSNSCTFAPKKGTQTFYKLKKELGYQKAWEVFGIINNPKFLDKYGDSLSLNAEGIPSFESVINNSYIQQYLKTNEAQKLLQKQFKPEVDTLDNYHKLLEEAKSFNAQNKEFVAYIDYNEDKIQAKVVKRTKENEDIFNNQYMSQQLNAELGKILKPAGITEGMLNAEEVEAGRVGVTDFSKAKKVADDAVSMIRIANNKEGANALGEEFCHLIIGTKKDNPLIQRALDALANNEEALKAILQDEYEDNYQFHNGNMELLAEEALGQLLYNQMLAEKTGINPILNRAINSIKDKFKDIDETLIVEAIQKAETAMSEFAKGLVSGDIKVIAEDIDNSYREVEFNSLADRVTRNIEILKQARDTELKRYQISDKGQAAGNKLSNAMHQIENYRSPLDDTALGIFNYADLALKDLKNAAIQMSNISTMSLQDQFRILRGIKSTIDSYKPFVEGITNALNEEEGFVDDLFARQVATTAGGIQTQQDMKQVFEELFSVLNKIDNRMMTTCRNKFVEFLKPFVGDEIEIQIGKRKGEKLSIAKLVREAEADISFMDRWLDAMGDSSDVILQVFDAIVKKANDKARVEAIDYIRKVQALRIEAEKQGITEFSWMFEKDSNGNKTGDYISQYNEGQYRIDYANFMQSLVDKYGENPSGTDLLNKNQELQNWHAVHSYITISGKALPNMTMYRNSDYDKLSSTQKDLLKRFLDLKEEMDKKLPGGRVSRNKAIQQRKDGVQRILDTKGSPSAIWQNVKNALKSEWLDAQEDDDTVYGSISRGLTDFNGKEYMTLPVLYTTRLKDANELTEDVFGSLMAYASSSTQYAAISDVIDPLEIGKYVVTEGRKVVKNRGQKVVEEALNVLGSKVVNRVFEASGSNMAKRLEDFFESQVYQRYLKDEGTIFGTKVSTSKAVTQLLKWSSKAQLGLNWLANLGNVVTGVAMQNIEAVAGEYFNPKELAAADAAYLAEMKDVMLEIGNRTKKAKLNLIDEYFNIKGEFNKNMRFADNRRSLLKRIFGSNILFLGQECGDHWLYNRTLIAMMKREKVKVNGTEMSLWNAIQVKEDVNGLAYLDINGITDLNGNTFDMAAFSRKVLHVNQGLFGIYNDEDTSAANRVAVGRLLLQYRKWMKAQYNKRFQSAQMSLATNQWEEGYYRTGVKFLVQTMQELRRGQFQLLANFNNLSNHEKANIFRCMAEIAQFAVVWGIANLVDWDNDKDRPYIEKLLEYLSQRAEHELGNLTPSFTMVNETLKTVKTPAASLSAVQSALNLLQSICSPLSDWDNEINSGMYKGHSTLYKNFMKAPIPGISQYRQLDKFFDDIDNSISYYTRSY